MLPLVDKIKTYLIFFFIKSRFCSIQCLAPLNKNPGNVTGQPTKQPFIIGQQPTKLKQKFFNLTIPKNIVTMTKRLCDQKMF